MEATRRVPCARRDEPFMLRPQGRFISKVFPAPAGMNRWQRPDAGPHERNACSLRPQG